MKLTILQWNIWYQEDIRNVVRFLREHPADVICLQELSIQKGSETGHAPHFIAKQLGYHYYYKEIEIAEGLSTLANGIFSRYPIVATHWQWINQTTGAGGYDDENRAYIEVILDVNGQKCTVATTHMSYTNAFASTPRKLQETQNLVEILKTKHSNFIFTGDLNAALGSPTIQAINKILKHVGPDFNHNTWTTKPFFYQGFEETERNWRLDYIFATLDVRTLNAKVIETEYSDHLPVYAEVEVAAAQKPA